MSPGPEPSARELASTEHRALGWSALLATAAIVWITLPVGTGILLGILMAFTLQPVYERLSERLGRPRLAALATVLMTTLVILATVALFGSLVAVRGGTLARKLVATANHGTGGHGLSERADSLLGRFGVSHNELQARIRAGASEIAGRAAQIAEAFAAQTANVLLSLVFSVMTMYLVIRNWGPIARRAELVLPLRPEYTRALFEEFRRVGRTTLFGTVVTGVAQGLLAALGFWVTRVPEPVLFGALTALASLIPAVGTLLVWLPIGVILLATGSTVMGIVELAWGAAVIVGVSDYVIRPRLVGGDETVPTLVTFAALFGGVEVFGLKGLILGPLVMSLAIAVLRLYATEMAAARGKRA